MWNKSTIQFVIVTHMLSLSAVATQHVTATIGWLVSTMSVVLVVSTLNK